MTILLEVCIDSIASANAAKQGGADRLEVCGPLASGGTTPSFGLVEQCVADLQMPVMMMIRPHDGGFHYDDDDIDTMLTDIEVAKSIGVQGVVFGCLTADREIDRPRCQALLDAAESLESTFHRAFDVTTDPLASFDLIQELGFSRLLTSGHRATARDGATLIGELVRRSTGTSILAGAGVKPENVADLIADTGVREVHASASVTHASAQQNQFVSFGDHRRVCDAEIVKRLKAKIT